MSDSVPGVSGGISGVSDGISGVSDGIFGVSDGISGVSFLYPQYSTLLYIPYPNPMYPQIQYPPRRPTPCTPHIYRERAAAPARALGSYKSIHCMRSLARMSRYAVAYLCGIILYFIHFV
jgi:hypothetical protein